MEMLVSMKNEIYEKEKRGGQQHRIREEFMEANFRRREQLLKQREEEWKEEMERRKGVLMKRLD